MADNAHETGSGSELKGSRHAGNSDRSVELRRRQSTFKDEVARTRERLASLPKGWENRRYSGDWADPDSEGLTPQFWIGVILLILVVALIAWGLMSPDVEEEVR